jgi:hypothetical protein
LSSHLVAAFVDSGVVITIDAEGNVLREAAQVTRVPDRPDFLDPLQRLPVNYGAGYDNIVGLGDPMSEPPRDDRPERLTFDSIKALMRHPVGGTDGPLSGSSGGRRRTKPKSAPATAWVGHGTGGHVPSIKFSGMTLGERAFYDRRPADLARTVLKQLVGQIIRDEVQEPRVKVTSSSAPIEVFGLSDPELRILRAYRNAARIALIAYARDNATKSDGLLREERVNDPKRVAMLTGA